MRKLYQEAAFPRPGQPLIYSLLWRSQYKKPYAWHITSLIYVNRYICLTLAGLDMFSLSGPNCPGTRYLGWLWIHSLLNTGNKGVHFHNWVLIGAHSLMKVETEGTGDGRTQVSNSTWHTVCNPNTQQDTKIQGHLGLYSKTLILKRNTK